MALIQTLTTNTFDEWRTQTNAVSAGVGDFTALNTVSVSLTGAVNEVKDSDLTFNGNKTFTGTTALAGTNISGPVLMTGSAITFNNGTVNTYTVDTATGNTYAAGTLDVDGEANFNSNLIIDGDLTVNGRFITVDSLNSTEPTLALNVDKLPFNEYGLIVNRESPLPDVKLVFSEITDRWTLTNDGTIFKNIVTSVDDTLFDIIDSDGTTVSISSNDSIQFAEGVGLDVNFTDVGGPSYLLSLTNVDRGSTQNIFKNVAVSGQPTVVADNNNDTLTFAVGNSGIALTANATTDTINILHADTSAVSNLASDNTGAVVLQDIAFNFDDFGHVTSATVGTLNLDTRYYTETESDARFLGIAAKAADSDLLDGLDSTFFRDASNLNTGTISDLRLPDTITSSITGNAATATKLLTARTISLAGDATGSASFDGSADVTITASVLDDSHLHSSGTISDFTEAVQDVVGGMVSTNSELGLVVTYDDTAGKLNFDVNDFTITIGGVITGVGTVSNLGNTTITASFADGSTVDNAQTANVATNVDLAADNTTNATHYITFANGVSGSQKIQTDTGLTYNPSSNALTATTFVGTATNATNAVNATNATNATTATQANQLTTARTISLGGDVSGSASFNGTANITITATVVDDSHTHDGRYFTEAESNANYLGRAINVWQTSSDGRERLYFANVSHTYIKAPDNIIFRTENGNVDNFVMNGNDFTAAGNITAFSDERLKTNWESLDSNFVELLAQVKNGTFDRTDAEMPRQVGVSAQSLEAIMPEAIKEDERGIKTVNYGAAAMASVVELAKLVVEQQKQIEELKAIINKS